MTALGAGSAAAQARVAPDWHPIGNTLQLLGLPGLASGPVQRVWFAGDAGRLTVQLPDGRVLVTTDLDRWANSTDTPPQAAEREALPRLERGPMTRRGVGAVRWAAGEDLWRSGDGGRSWRNLTHFQGSSILGGPVLDFVVAPGGEEKVVVAATTGLWLSNDGGMSWAGLNDALENLPVARLIAAPSGASGMRISVDAGDRQRELEWAPGQRAGWVGRSNEPDEARLRRQLSATLEAQITAASASGDAIYAGSGDGRLWSSVDHGRTWRSAAFGGGSVAKLWLDPLDSRFALAALSGPGARDSRVLRTLNGGVFWDDLTANLPDAEVRGVTADRTSGAIYVATSRGVYVTFGDLRAPAPATAWSALAGMPAGAAVRDVMLDDAGARLYAALDYRGVFVTPAPHRARAPLVVHSADFSPRAAAPGALLSVIGRSVETASAGETAAPVLNASAQESQIQIPFEVSGDSLQLRLSGQGGNMALGVALKAASPAILVDRDGTPILLDAETGVQLDAMNPARGGMRVQILASGLGRVTPDWPTGMPGPLDNTPRVVNPVRATLDGAPLEVTRATLAPGYVGYYLVEVTLPDFLDAGASELALESAGNQSNRVRIYVDR